MPMNDVFTPDAFGLVAMTEAVNKAPYVPGRLGKMGLFKPKGVSTITIAIEEKQGVLALLPAITRGGPATSAVAGTRKMVPFNIPCFAYEDALLAASIQGVRKFGSENESEAVSEVVADKLEDMKNTHEATKEWLRMGAVHGIVKDGAGDTIYNLFTQFGITAPADVDFVLGTTTTNILGKCLAVKRTMEDALGNTTFDHVHALCGQTWFDAFTNHTLVRYAYQLYKESEVLRADMRKGFEFGGIIFEEYRGQVGHTKFVADGDARFFPVGGPGIFVEYYAPADFLETANQIGLPLYAKQEPTKYDRGIGIHVQSNTLSLCTRPGCLIRGHTSN